MKRLKLIPPLETDAFIEACPVLLNVLLRRNTPGRHFRIHGSLPFLALLIIAFSSLSLHAFSQSVASDQAILTKARALYDSPFTRDLISFDCAVQFDWKQHFVDIMGTVPPTAVPTIEHLQVLQHRVFVDRSGAVVSVIPKSPELSGVAHDTELEQAFGPMVASGLNAWIPFSTNVILPVGPTKFNFEKIDTGYLLTMNGHGVAAELLIADDLRLTSGVSQLPQPMRFTTEFKSGPDGLLLSSVKTEDTTDAAVTKGTTFTFTYQAVQGFQLPSTVTIRPAVPGTWHYTLTDCKAMTGIKIKVGLPKK